jgi:hypothetical protein
MPVTAGATSTEANLNDTTPAAPAGSINVKFQAGAPTTDPNDPNFQVRDISAYVLNFGGQTFSAITTGAPDSTFNLTAAGAWKNLRWIIKKADNGAGKVKVTPHAGDTIEGNAEYDLPNQYDFVELISDGTNIFIIGSNTA